MEVNQACGALGKLADDAHDPVLQIYIKQNRELSYAIERWASRSCKRNLSR